MTSGTPLFQLKGLRSFGIDTDLHFLRRTDRRFSRYLRMHQHTRLWRLHGNELSCSSFVFETAFLLICYVIKPSPPCDALVSTCIVDGSGATLARDASRAHRKGFSCSPAVRLLMVLARLRDWAIDNPTVVFADFALYGNPSCTSSSFNEAKRNCGRIIFRATPLPPASIS